MSATVPTIPTAAVPTLTPVDRAAELRAYWQRILDGVETPMAVEPVPEVEADLVAKEKRLGIRFDEMARQDAHFNSRHALEYPDEPVIAFRTRAGWAVVGVGEVALDAYYLMPVLWEDERWRMAYP